MSKGKASKFVEDSARICYRSVSTDLKTPDDFVRMLIKRGHEAMIEHVVVTVDFVCDRGVTHEIVRHRLASYAQESTRFINYTKDGVVEKAGIRVIRPPCKCKEADKEWLKAMKNAEKSYFKMILLGEAPQIARSVLPNSTASRIRVTMNMHAWRNFFRLRTAAAAHPQMQEVAKKVLAVFRKQYTAFVEDIQ